ncbi:unannotated protein [freshwater metagenome]|uniref:Unannotated protein n=1 Tax=freshwater metagenome TaxID=449393 RepID=A0A6J7KDG0_9ZZZZ
MTLDEIRPDGTAFVNYELVEAIVNRYTHPKAIGPDAWLESVVRERIWHLGNARARAGLKAEARREAGREQAWLSAQGRLRWGNDWANIIDASDATVDEAHRSMTDIIHDAVVLAAEHRRASWEVQELNDQLIAAVARQADPAEIERRQRVYSDAIERMSRR